MKFIFTPMDEANARSIQSWNYEVPYNIYNWEAEDDISEMLDRRSPHYAVKDEHGELIGFFAFGSSALVWDSGEPHLFSENNTIAIGLGMRPDLTGKQFKPDYFRLFVLTFNQRAIRVYEHAGFQRVGIYVQPNASGNREFLEMRKAPAY